MLDRLAVFALRAVAVTFTVITTAFTFPGESIGNGTSACRAFFRYYSGAFPTHRQLC
ncbi:hypothetical protein K0B04_03885 [Patescibacteria group bacterium]|nr:hypothetical protein [Patescibacteria group bacterium]